MFMTPSSKGTFYSLSSENQKGLSLLNPIIQAGDIWKISEILDKYKSFCASQNTVFDLRTFFGLPETSTFFTIGEFGKQRVRGTSKMDRVLPPSTP